jgi:hypothetical protein
MTHKKQDKHEEGVNTFQSEDLKELDNFGYVSILRRKMKLTFKVLGFEGTDCTQRCEISGSHGGE